MELFTMFGLFALAVIGVVLPGCFIWLMFVQYRYSRDLYECHLRMTASGRDYDLRQLWNWLKREQKKRKKVKS